MLQHPEFSVLIAYHRGELTEKDAQTVENHVSSCKACGILINDALIEANQPDAVPPLSDNISDKLIPASYIEKLSQTSHLKPFVSRRNNPMPGEIWSASNNLVFVHQKRDDFFISSTISHFVEYASDYDLILSSKESGIPYDCIIQVWNTYTVPGNGFEHFRYRLKKKHINQALTLYKEFLNPGSQNLAGIKRGNPIKDINDPRNRFIEQCILDASEIKDKIFTAANLMPEYESSENIISVPACAEATANSFDYTQGIREWIRNAFAPGYSLAAAPAKKDKTIPRFMYIKKDKYIEAALEYDKDTGTVNVLISAAKNVDYKLSRRQKKKQAKWRTLKPGNIFNKTVYFNIGKAKTAMEKYEYILEYTKKIKGGRNAEKSYKIKF